MHHSFQIRRPAVLDNAKYVMENMVYDHVKCFKGWIAKINGVLLRKRNFAFVCFCCLGGDHYLKDSKKEESVEYKIVTRTITSCYIF